MSRLLPNLNALRAFEAAARHLSFSKAADELCVTQGAISRHIKTLEAELKVLLFRRMTRAVQLTPEGQDYLQAARDAFDRIEQAGARLTSNRTRDVLTVSALPTFAMRWLVPRLPRFTAAHPQTEVHMVTSIAPVSFGRDAIDLAIRVGRPPELGTTTDRPRIDLQMVEDWSSVHADLLMPDVLVPVCSPRLIREGDILSEPADLLRYPLLHMATRQRAWPDWLRSFGLTSPPTRDASAYGHFFAVVQAALDGEGIALVPRALAEREIANGELIVPTDHSVESEGSYYVLCRRQQRETRPIQQFRLWLLAEGRQTSPNPKEA
ncbi:transcriptional regulator GcvA [Roseomonas chloroacetimidivorans]|jgi:LysR family glycine cleavage system transcriptional activator|uniref:transcriptional regulator GcvA n=1 Tax=Roseomonas chloroacetimidivorans TaxID=1766656 RepID=UPI003C71B2ED